MNPLKNRLHPQNLFGWPKLVYKKTLWELKKNGCQGLVDASSNTCTDCACGGSDKLLAETLGNYGDIDATLNKFNSIATSEGSYPNRTVATELSKRKVQLTTLSVFNYAIFARDDIFITNNTEIDSYDSEAGPYGGSNANENGDVGTNGTSSGVINLANGVTIKGHASTGPGGTIANANGSTITQGTSATNDLVLPVIPVPADLTSLASSGTLNVLNSDTHALSNQDYRFSNIWVANGSTLTIDGDVRLYVTNSNAVRIDNNSDIVINEGATLTIYTEGSFSVTNNSQINNTKASPTAKDLTIYSSHSGGSGVNLWNNIDFYGTVYAPNTTVFVSNNGETFGSFRRS